MEFIEIIDSSKSLNSSIVSMPRIQILSSLAFLEKDGALYRDLKASLKMDDGVLYSNLTFLLKIGYIIKKEIQFENKKMDAFIITNEGKEELVKLKNWIKKWIKTMEMI